MPNYRFGKHPPKIDYRTLRFENYVTAALAPPPATFNVLTSVYQKLKTSDPTKLFPGRLHHRRSGPRHHYLRRPGRQANDYDESGRR